MSTYIGKCYCIQSFTEYTGEVSFLKDHIYDLYDEGNNYYWIETDKFGLWRINSAFHGCRFHVNQGDENIVNVTPFHKNFILLKEYRKLKLQKLSINN